MAFKSSSTTRALRHITSRAAQEIDELRNDLGDDYRELRAEVTTELRSDLAEISNDVRSEVVEATEDLKAELRNLRIRLREAGRTSPLSLGRGKDA